MSWEIVYSDQARQDLRSVYEYIAFSLFEKSTAVQLYKDITAEINALDMMPKRYPLYHDEPWHSLGVHYLSVKDYLIFYHVDDEKERVSIVRIGYGGQDIGRFLSETSV